MMLNLGSHNKRIDGYTNVDVLDLPNVDIVHDLNSFPWPFEMSSVDGILMQEFLEHISWRNTQAVINECYRILKPGGKINIQVPDIEAMCRMIDEQCFCVPIKAATYEDYEADPDCKFCSGKAKINPMRWHIAFVGAQKHTYDLHRNVFTLNSLKNHLEKAMFKNITRHPNIYKLVVVAEK
jgi:ubiquinone/menaquinone biosynthesis C-methylase UbiE